jgi:SAM-dependent methyltransferase
MSRNKRKVNMKKADDAFRTGAYHQSFKRSLLRRRRTAQMQFFYMASERLIQQVGWPDPLAQEVPRVLLCGTASPYTTLTFARFVSRRNDAAHIDVLDIASLTLHQSEGFLREYPDIDMGHIAFVEADARAMPFADEQFDWIETDFLIQFFSAQQKLALFREWYRVLKPDGIITTRDWLMERTGFIERAMVGAKTWLIRNVLGPVTYPASTAEVRKLAAQVGFASAVGPVRIAGRLKVPAMQHLLLYKPNSG